MKNWSDVQPGDVLAGVEIQGRKVASENPLATRVKELEAALKALSWYVRDEDGDCLLCGQSAVKYRSHRPDRRHKSTCPMVELGFLEVDDL